MKKIVFLFLLVNIVAINSKYSVKANDVTYDFGDYSIVISDYVLGGQRGFTIEKVGLNGFYKTVNLNGEYDYITGVKVLDNLIFAYGYGFVSGGTYDALFYVFDQTGNIIHKSLIDFGELETVQNIFIIEEVYIIQTEQVFDREYSYEFSANYFTAFDLDFNYIDDLKVSAKIHEIVNNERNLLLKYNKSESFNLAIRNDLSTFSKDIEIEIQDGAVYTDDLYIEFINSAILNEETINNGVLIDYPGNYRLEYNSKIYNFSMIPKVFGVEDDAIYISEVVPSVNKGNILLNNDLFVSGTEVSKPGNYEMIVLGAGDYQQEINFTIAHKLSGIVSNQIYEKPVTISFNGDAYLNDQYIQSPYEITDNGEYVLKIKGENNYQETYYFQIVENSDKVTMIDFIQKFDIFILVVVLISGFIILKKK